MCRLPKIIRSVPGEKCYCSKLLGTASREQQKEKKNETHCLLSTTRMAAVIVHYSTRQAQGVWLHRRLDVPRLEADRSPRDRLQSFQLNDAILERYCYCLCSIRYFQFVSNASYMASNSVTAYIESFSYLVVS